MRQRQEVIYGFCHRLGRNMQTSELGNEVGHKVVRRTFNNLSVCVCVQGLILECVQTAFFSFDYVVLGVTQCLGE